LRSMKFDEIDGGFKPIVRNRTGKKEEPIKGKKNMR